MASFSNAEAAYQFTDAMPFLLEDGIQNHGDRYTKRTSSLALRLLSAESGKLVTGENPPSASDMAIWSQISRKSAAPRTQTFPTIPGRTCQFSYLMLTSSIRFTSLASDADASSENGAVAIGMHSAIPSLDDTGQSNVVRSLEARVGRS
ncbi:hypothetical protein BDW67DRAFT_186539 [Aspergillus spinulosporus]